MHGMWLLVIALVPMLSMWFPILHSGELLHQGYLQGDQLAQQDVGIGHAMYTLSCIVGDRQGRQECGCRRRLLEHEGP